MRCHSLSSTLVTIEGAQASHPVGHVRQWTYQVLRSLPGDEVPVHFDKRSVSAAVGSGNVPDRNARYST